jgi:hypothetical protein
MRSFRTFAVAVSTLAIAGCSGNNSPLCTTVPIQNVTTPQMVYPVPSFASVPAGAPAMVVAYTASPELAQTITITPSGGSPIALGPMGAAPKVMPSPYVHNPSGGGTFYGVTLPALKPHTHYTVAYRYTSSAGLCGQSTTASIPMGGFSTQ